MVCQLYLPLQFRALAFEIFRSPSDLSHIAPPLCLAMAAAKRGCRKDLSQELLFGFYSTQLSMINPTFHVSALRFLRRPSNGTVAVAGGEISFCNPSRQHAVDPRGCIQTAHCQPRYHQPRLVLPDYHHCTATTTASHDM